MLVERHSPLLVSQDPSKAKNAKESKGSNKSKGQDESAEEDLLTLAQLA